MAIEWWGQNDRYYDEKDPDDDDDDDDDDGGDDEDDDHDDDDDDDDDDDGGDDGDDGDDDAAEDNYDTFSYKGDESTSDSHHSDRNSPPVTSSSLWQDYELQQLHSDFRFHLSSGPAPRWGSAFWSRGWLGESRSYCNLETCMYVMWCDVMRCDGNVCM